jgi:hypothetical protein
MTDENQLARTPVGRKAYETADVSFRGLMFTAAGILGLMCLILLLSWSLLRFFKSENPGVLDSPFTEPRNLPAEPRLQPSPETDLRAFLSYEDSVLSGYGWVNRDSGIVRVPIDTAIEMVLKEGLPHRENSREIQQR